MAATTPYDTIGGGYAARRAADPRLASAIVDALGGAERILNVGAGTGNYEPADRAVVAVEPSSVMIGQRGHRHLTNLRPPSHDRTRRVDGRMSSASSGLAMGG